MQDKHLKGIERFFSKCWFMDEEDIWHVWFDDLMIWFAPVLLNSLTCLNVRFDLIFHFLILIIISKYFTYLESVIKQIIGSSFYMRWRIPQHMYMLFSYYCMYVSLIHIVHGWCQYFLKSVLCVFWPESSSICLWFIYNMPPSPIHIYTVALWCKSVSILSQQAEMRFGITHRSQMSQSPFYGMNTVQTLPLPDSGAKCREGL